MRCVIPGEQSSSQFHLNFVEVRRIQRSRDFINLQVRNWVPTNLVKLKSFFFLITNISDKVSLNREGKESKMYPILREVIASSIPYFYRHTGLQYGYTGNTGTNFVTPPSTYTTFTIPLIIIFLSLLYVYPVLLVSGHCLYDDDLHRINKKKILFDVYIAGTKI